MFRVCRVCKVCRVCRVCVVSHLNQSRDEDSYPEGCTPKGSPEFLIIWPYMFSGSLKEDPKAPRAQS